MINFGQQEYNIDNVVEVIIHWKEIQTQGDKLLNSTEESKVGSRGSPYSSGNLLSSKEMILTFRTLEKQYRAKPSAYSLKF